MRFIVALVWFVIAMLTAVFLGSVIRESVASPSCLTKTEARKLFHDSHLYWHTERHCWDDRPPWRARQARAEEPISTPKLSDIHWMTRDFDQPDVFDVILSPSSYDPVIVPQPETSSDEIYGNDEFNYIDAQAVEPAPVEPVQPPERSVTAILLISSAVFLFAVGPLLFRQYRPNIRARHEANVSLSEILRRVDAGDPVFIERYGRIV